MKDIADASEGRIVVGVDGSVPSKAALAWAVHEAARTNRVVEAVTAYYWFPMPINDVDIHHAACPVVVIRGGVADRV